MRIAAGVLLIVAALFNLFAAMGYGIFGGATSALGEAASQLAADAGRAGAAQADIDSVRAAGGLLMVFGVFLLVSVGVLITGAVFAFKNTKATWVLIAGIFALVAEAIGIYQSGFGLFSNIWGIVAGILAIITAKTMGEATPQTA